MIAKLFTLIVIILTLTGCGSNGSGSVAIPEEPELLLEIQGKIQINDVKFPTLLCDNNSYQFRDLSVFDISIQDKKDSASVNLNGEFAFKNLIPCEQFVLFCRNKNNPNLCFETMFASSYGLSGLLKVEISIYSTARSLIARTLRDKYGRRVKPEAIPDEYIKNTVDTITNAIEKNPELFQKYELSEIPEIKESYILMADKLNAGNSGSFPCEEVFIFYFAGDNDLAHEFVNSALKIAEVGNPKNTEIIIAIDTNIDLPVVNKTGAARYIVSDKKLKLLDFMGALDSTDPAHLKRILETTIREYPAKNYSLILSGHGGGWRGEVNRFSSNRLVFTNDNTSIATGTFITFVDAIENALSGLNASNRTFNTVVIDACNMGCIEVAYQLNNVADFVVFSEALMPSQGIPYDAVFESMNQSGIENISNESRARLFCSKYVEKYVEKTFSFDTGITLVSVKNLKDYILSFTEYCAGILDNITSTGPLIYNIRNKKTTNDGKEVSGDVILNFGPLKEYVDLKQLIMECRPSIPAVNIQTDELLRKFDSIVLYKNYSRELKEASGLSITFPDKDLFQNSYNGISPALEYFNLKFNIETNWSKILEKILSQ